MVTEFLSEEIIAELILRAASPPAHLECARGIVELRTLLTLSCVCRLFRDLVRGLWTHKKVRGVVVDFTSDEDLHRLLKSGSRVIRCAWHVSDILEMTKAALVEFVIPTNYAGEPIEFLLVSKRGSATQTKYGLARPPAVFLTLDSVSASSYISGEKELDSSATLLALGMEAKRISSAMFAEDWRISLDYSGVTRYQSMLALVTEPDEYAPFRSIRVSHLPAVIRRPIDWILQGKRVVDASGDFRAYVRKTLGVQDVDQDWVETLKRRLWSIRKEDLDEHTADALLQDIATEDGIGALDEGGLAFEIPLGETVASLGDGRIFGADKEALSCIVLPRERLEKMIFQAGVSCNESFPVADSDLVVMSTWLEDVRKAVSSVIALRDPL